MNARSTATQAIADGPEPIDWRSELMTRWQALGYKFLAVNAEHRISMAQLLAECTQLVVVWAIVQAHGNLTRAASWLRSSRRRVRHHLGQWCKHNPQLVPPRHSRAIRQVEGEQA